MSAERDDVAAPTEDPDGRARRRPTGVLAVLGAVAGCTAFGEGALTDRGALLLRSELRTALDAGGDRVRGLRPRRGLPAGRLLTRSGRASAGPPATSCQRPLGPPESGLSRASTDTASVSPWWEWASSISCAASASTGTATLRGRASRISGHSRTSATIP